MSRRQSCAASASRLRGTRDRSVNTLAASSPWSGRWSRPTNTYNIFWRAGQTMDEENDSKPSSVTNFDSSRRLRQTPPSPSAPSTRDSIPVQIPTVCLSQLRENCSQMFNLLSSVSQMAPTIFEHTASPAEGGLQSVSPAECSAFAHLCQVMEDTAEDIASHSRVLYDLTTAMLTSPQPPSSGMI